MLKLPLDTPKTATFYVAKSNTSLTSPSPRKSDLRMSIGSPRTSTDVYEIHSPTTPQKNVVSPRKAPKMALSPLSPYGKQQSEPKSSFAVAESDMSNLERASPGLSFISNQSKHMELSKMDHLFREDYGGHKKPYKPKEDAEDVKRLDEWQSSIRRNQAISGVMKPKDLLEQHMLRESKDKDRDDFPKVRQELFNKIISDPVFEDERDKLPSLYVEKQPFADRDSMDAGTNNRTTISSLEVLQRDNNKEILVELINRKIREHLNISGLVGMTDDQLRVHVKKLADRITAQFRALKGSGGSLILHNCIESTIKLLKHQRDNLQGGFDELPKKNNIESEFSAVDYEVMENLLMEKFEVCERETMQLANKVKNLTIESYNLKKDLMLYRGKLDDLEKNFGDLLKDGSSEPASAKKRAVRTGQVFDYENINSKMILTKIEKQNENLMLTKKIYEIQDRLVVTTHDLQVQESYLENTRGQMVYYKTQLRDMYYKCLKDDVALLKEGRNKRSYAWVIRSLWKIKEDITIEAFPSYLEPPSVKFLMDYARAQNELEEFCKENKIMNLIMNAVDFKYLNKRLDSGLPQETAVKNAGSMENLDSSPYLNKPKSRNLKEMLGDVQERMSAMKRVNLKAKKQVFATGKNALKKGPPTRWEEVDPTDYDKRLYTAGDDFNRYSENLDMDKNRKLFDSKIGCQGFINMQIEEHNNIIWEQGMEKLKALSASQKKEADRLIKQNLSKELDERLKSNLQKTFLFLFGRQGQDSLSKFIRDKTIYEQNAQGKAKKANLINNLQPAQQPGRSSTDISSPSTAIPSFRNTYGTSFYRKDEVVSAEMSPRSPLFFKFQGSAMTPRDKITRVDFANSTARAWS